MNTYPVHRQRWPPSTWSFTSSIATPSRWAATSDITMPRRAESALQTMLFMHRTLHGVVAVVARNRLDRFDLSAVGLRCERETRPHCTPVPNNRAGATRPLLATNVRAGEAELVAYEIGQQHPRRHVDLVRGAVDGQADAVIGPLRSARRAPARPACQPATAGTQPCRARRFGDRRLHERRRRPPQATAVTLVPRLRWL